MPISPQPALVGRARELAELESALAAAEAGQGGLALIVGEPGIGKTALADAFTAAAAGRGATLAWGRAWEAGGAPALWPWIEVLRELLAGADPDAAGAVGASLAVVAELIPEACARFPAQPAPPPLEPAQARFRLFDAVATLLRWSARDRPLVVALDDLHAADPATLSLLQFAARAVRRARVLLLGTVRDVEARLTPEVAEQLARIAREGRYLVLPRLERADVAAWVAASGGAPPAELADLLYERTEGNPLFLVESYRLMRARRWQAPAGSWLPEGVREVIAARLRALASAAREALEVCAVLGRSVDLRLAAAAGGLSDEQLQQRLDEARRAELIAPAGDRWLFTHILVRDVLHANLPPGRRAELHQAVAAALAADPLAPPAELVHHMFEAVPRVPLAAAIDCARRAAAAAATRLAFDDAVAFLERSVAALPAGGDPGERCDLLLELARARIAAGMGMRGREAAQAAAGLARALGDPARLAAAALTYGEVITPAVVDATMVQLLEEALAAIPAGDSELRARLLGRLAAALQPAADPSRPMAIARDAIAMSRRLAGERAHLEVLQSAISALLYFAEPAERIELNREMVDLAGRLGDRARVLRGHLRLVIDYLELGDAARADACIAAYESLARDIGHPVHLWYAPMLRAMRATMQGRFAEAEELAGRARALAERTQDPGREMTLALQRLGLLATRAQHELLAAESPALLDVVGTTADRWFAAGCRLLVAVRLGRPDDMRAALTAYDSGIREGRGRMSIGWVAEAAVALGDTGLAAHAHELLAPLAARNHCWGLVGFTCEGPLARPLGIAAAALGRMEEAERHFEDARVRADALEAPPIRARIELDWAAALLRHGGTGDRARARALLESAQAAADRLGLAAIAESAAAMLDRLRDPGIVRAIADPAAVAAPAGVPVASAFTLDREGEYWTLGWDGRSFRLKDSRGLQILHHLVSHPDREFHVTDLLAPAGESGLIEDAGEMLDQPAIASYRQRLAEIKVELDEAERWNDRGRAAGLREEMEFLAAELSRAVGLGGRRRHAASTAEKARINVRRRISHAVDRIAEHSPALARHLEWAVKTGHFCVYHPTGRPR